MLLFRRWIPLHKKFSGYFPLLSLCATRKLLETDWIPLSLKTCLEGLVFISTLKCAYKCDKTLSLNIFTTRPPKALLVGDIFKQNFAPHSIWTNILNHWRTFHSPFSTPPPSLKLFPQLPFVVAPAEGLQVLQWSQLSCVPLPTDRMFLPLLASNPVTSPKIHLKPFFGTFFCVVFNNKTKRKIQTLFKTKMFGLMLGEILA